MFDVKENKLSDSEIEKMQLVLYAMLDDLPLYQWRVLDPLPLNTKLVFAAILSSLPHGYVPTLREIGEIVGLNHAGILRHHIPRLEARGLIVWPRDRHGRRRPGAYRLGRDEEIHGFDADEAWQ